MLGTGASFALFGVGALALGTLGRAGVALLPGGAELRERRMQRLVHHGFRGFVRFMTAVGAIAVRVRHPERLDGGEARLLVANHPSLIDYVLLASLLPQLDCVVKQGVVRSPFMAGVVRGAGFVAGDGGEAMVEACAERLARGRSVLVFPEGTRSPRAGLGPMKRGAAHVALRSGRPLHPVTITCEPRGLTGDEPWWDVPPRRMQFTLEVGEPIHPPAPGASRALRARDLTATLREHFEKRLGTDRG